MWQPSEQILSGLLKDIWKSCMTQIKHTATDLMLWQLAGVVTQNGPSFNGFVKPLIEFEWVSFKKIQPLYTDRDQTISLYQPVSIFISAAKSGILIWCSVGIYFFKPVSSSLSKKKKLQFLALVLDSFVSLGLGLGLTDWKTYIPIPRAMLLA